MIETLIDKLDTFELVRDKIALIIATESANQQILAANAAKDPELWKLDVYIERANPWEKWLNDPSSIVPIINVWFDSTAAPQAKGNVVDRQTMQGTFNIDCYGFGRSRDDGGSGHIPGDELAAKEAHRGLRLCRNIIMAGEYTYLGFPRVKGTAPNIGQRWVQSISTFQPQLDGRTVQQIVGSRFALSVMYNELSPQIQGGDLEFISVDVERGEDGLLLVEADYDYT